MIVNTLCVLEMKKNSILYIHTQIYILAIYIYVYIYIITGLLTLLLNFSIPLHIFYVLDTTIFEQIL